MRFANLSRIQAQMPTGIELSLFQKILLTTDGTVTNLISLYTDEMIRVNHVEQSYISGDQVEDAECCSHHRLLKRGVILGSAKQNYLYAESYIVTDNLPDTIKHSLLETDSPIGLLWKKERSELYRDIGEAVIEEDSHVCNLFQLPGPVPILSRTYRVYYRKQLQTIISEKFPVTYFQEIA